MQFWRLCASCAIKRGGPTGGDAWIQELLATLARYFAQSEKFLMRRWLRDDNPIVVLGGTVLIAARFEKARELSCPRLPDISNTKHNRHSW